MMHTYCSDVVIHIDEDLQDDAIHALEKDIGSIPGVYSACVNDRARHLMLIDYDPEGIHATDLLSQVRQRGVGAELVGL
ncbi:heavy-metal-associated domain-containing protein [Thiosocius teredinicola]|uniref:heavy-metal-associated domain-containing protein n=1 Tax=Thiosocius teredinicola TaxID=1973002 RepID=UPI002FE48987